MRRMWHVRGIATGRAGDEVQADVRGDTLEIACVTPVQGGQGWLCRVPVVGITSFDLAKACAPAASGPISRLLGRKSASAGGRAAPECVLEMLIQRDGKVARVALTGSQADAEGLMYDLTSARRVADAKFDVAL